MLLNDTVFMAVKICFKDTCVNLDRVLVPMRGGGAKFLYGRRIEVVNDDLRLRYNDLVTF